MFNIYFTKYLCTIVQRRCTRRGRRECTPGNPPRWPKCLSLRLTATRRAGQLLSPSVYHSAVLLPVLFCKQTTQTVRLHEFASNDNPNFVNLCKLFSKIVCHLILKLSFTLFFSVELFSSLPFLLITNSNKDLYL